MKRWLSRNKENKDLQTLINTKNKNPLTCILKMAR